MKRSILFILSLIVNILLNTQSIHAQVVVKIKPHAPAAIVARPAMHGRGLVWIEPEWVWNPRLKEYKWKEGRWIKPKRHAVWIPGRWIDMPEGYKWSPGYWGRRK